MVLWIKIFVIEFDNLSKIFVKFIEYLKFSGLFYGYLVEELFYEVLEGRKDFMKDFYVVFGNLR